MRLHFALFISFIFLSGCVSKKPIELQYIVPTQSFPAVFSTQTCGGKIHQMAPKEYSVEVSCFKNSDSRGFYMLLLRDGIEQDRVYLPSERTKYGTHTETFQAEPFNGVAIMYKFERRY